MVLENDEVTTRLMAVDDAREAGARALFGEKYGDEVRVVSMGKTAREHGANALGWSVELCGGTHVRRTGDIGLISVTGESAVASGVRRIEALTGRHARKHANDTIAARKDRGRRTAHHARRDAGADRRADGGAQEARARSVGCAQEAGDGRRRGRVERIGGGGCGVREVGNVKLMARAVEGIEMKDLKSLADDGKKQLGSGVVAIVGVTGDGKAGVVVGVTADLTARYNAVDLVRVALGSARRQGRRRPARHGAGRRPRWRQGGCGALGDRKGDGRRLAAVRAVARPLRNIKSAAA